MRTGALTTLLLTCLTGPTVMAEETLLTIRGTGCCEGRSEVTLNRSAFDALPQHSIVTQTPWTEGKHTYSGVLLRDLVRYAGLRGAEIKVAAINDYWATLPLSDAEHYPVLLASARDGQPLTLRTKGPLWVIYPLSDYPELDRELYHSRMVWQVNTVEGE